MPYDRYVNICVKKELRDRIKRLAEKNDIPMTKVIERAISLYERFDDILDEYLRIKPKRIEIDLDQIPVKKAENFQEVLVDHVVIHSTPGGIRIDFCKLADDGYEQEGKPINPRYEINTRIHMSFETFRTFVRSISEVLRDIESRMKKE